MGVCPSSIFVRESVFRYINIRKCKIIKCKCIFVCIAKCCMQSARVTLLLVALSCAARYSARSTCPRFASDCTTHHRQFDSSWPREMCARKDLSIVPSPILCRYWQNPPPIYPTRPHSPPHTRTHVGRRAVELRLRRLLLVLARQAVRGGL